MAFTAQATQLGEALFKLLIDNTGFTKGLSEAEKEAKERSDRIAGIFKDVGRVGAIGFGLGSALIGGFSKMAAESEGVLTRLRSTLVGMGEDADAQIPKLQAWAEALMKASDFDDDEILSGFRELVSLTGSVEDGMLAMEAATNLANTGQYDLTQGIAAVRGAFNGQEKALIRLGVSLSDGVRGHAALVEVMKHVQGTNERTADSTERHTRRMAVSYGEMGEALGAKFLPLVRKIIEVLTKAADAVAKMDDEQLSALANAIIWGTAISGLMSVLGNLGNAIFGVAQILRVFGVGAVAATGAAGEMGAGMTALAAPAGPIAAVIIIVAALILKLEQLQHEMNKTIDTQKELLAALNPNANKSNVNVGLNPDGTLIAETGEDSEGGTYTSYRQRLANAMNPLKYPLGPLQGLITEGSAYYDEYQAQKRTMQYVLRNRFNEPTPTQRQREKDRAKGGSSPGTTVNPWDYPGYNPPGQSTADTIRRDNSYAY